MDVLHSLVQKRNAAETAPFVAVYQSNATLTALGFKLENRCQQLDFECSLQKNTIDKLTDEVESRGPSKGELKQREKAEQLQRKLEERQAAEAELKEQSKTLSKELSQQIDTNEKQQKMMDALQEELKQKDVVITRITTELRESTSRTSLAEAQFDGMKDNLRRLQEENDQLTKSNDELVDRLVKDKEKYMEEMVKMTEMYEGAMKKIEMLTKLQEQEKRRFLWGRSKKSSSDADRSDPGSNKAATGTAGRQFGGGGVILPSSVKCKIAAHPAQVICVRYDSTGGDIIATASEDSTVKVWHTGNGQLLKTLHGGSSQVMLGLDMAGDLAAGCGSDKTCRVWNVRTQRLVHQLVGHSQKVTCVRMLQGGRSVLTASADRSMKVWDISRHTYRQMVTMRHSSTSNTIDTSYDSVSAVSGHLDGGVRFWDVRGGDRTGDVSGLHNGGVTSVNFNPSNNEEILTCGRDSQLKLVDVRKTGQELQTFYHADFRVDLSYAKCTISPDGKYAAAGSSNGDVFIWRTLDGNLERQLKGHDAGVVAVAWDRGGSNGQQFASIDKKGNLLLWA